MATIVDGNVHITGAGTSVITASVAVASIPQGLLVNPATITIAANNQSKVYGSPNPVLTATYTGFVYNDTQSSLTTQPVVATTATDTSSAGGYAITVTGAADPDYIIAYAPGTLTITKAPQTITFAAITDQTQFTTYTLSATASSGLPVTLVLANTAIAGIRGTTLSSNNPGSETITASQAGNANYQAAPSVSQTFNIVEPDNGEVVIAQVVSPNGDGIDDVLRIINIENYPDNKLTLINRNGVKVYEVSGYDNQTHVFDGHSSITGALQQQGTYLYLLQYRVNGEMKRKTGFTVLRY